MTGPQHTSLPETHRNGSVAPLTHAVACIITEARSTISYQNAVDAALKIIPLVRAADIDAGLRSREAAHG